MADASSRDLPEQGPSTDSVVDLISADDEQATAEARSDALAVARFFGVLVEHDLPDELAADLTRVWLDSYLDSTSCDD